jgi:hypothetical protein
MTIAMVSEKLLVPQPAGRAPLFRGGCHDTVRAHNHVKRYGDSE